MQSLRIPPAEHQPACKFVHDDDLSVLDHIVLVPPEQGMSLEGALHILSEKVIGGVIKVRCFEQAFTLQHPLHLVHASLSKVD